VAGDSPVSALDQALADYLHLRRSLGHELAEAGWLLPGFVGYLDSHEFRTVTIEATLAWVQQSATGNGPTVGPRRMTAVRGFARYLAGIDPNTEVPPLGLMPHQQRWRRPFIYSPADIDTVLNQARTTIGSRLRAATYATLIGLLAASGLRIGEAIKLDRGDVDWTEGVLLIRESKFGKSRVVPLQASSMLALEHYAELRDELQPRPEEPSFFVSRTRKRLIYAVVSQTFRQLVDTAGIGAGAPSAPRLHDLRHTFAVCTLLGWYRSGAGVQAKIPSLSTYLGHREPSSTYWYLSAAPELLARAAARQDTAWSAARS
jgi:integrase/recombinase XerD